MLLLAGTDNYSRLYADEHTIAESTDWGKQQFPSNNNGNCYCVSSAAAAVAVAIA